MSQLSDRIAKTIRDIPNFPKEGIVFKDITTVLADPKLFNEIIDYYVEQLKAKDIKAICGIESRGFIFGTPLAAKMDLPFIPIRKPGKLPAKTLSESYELEYGKDSLEIHEDSLDKIEGSKNIAVIDDLIATGGTALATANLLRKLKVDKLYLCSPTELSFLNGRNKMGNAYDEIITLVKF